MVRMRRPFVTAGLTTVLLFAALRAELDLRTPHGAVAGLHPPTAALATGSGIPRRTTSHRLAHHGATARRRRVHNRRPPIAAAGTAPAASRNTPPPAAAAPHPTTPAKPAAKPKPTPTPAAPSGMFTGSTASTPYGNVQVQIKVVSGRITDVVALQMPNDNQRSQRISQTAGPQLRQEALDAQSANIDDVSGATYTSDAYRQSLQSAIDTAGLH